MACSGRYAGGASVLGLRDDVERLTDKSMTGVPMMPMSGWMSPVFTLVKSTKASPVPGGSSSNKLRKD